MGTIRRPLVQHVHRMFRALACAGSLGLASGKIYFSETFGDGWESRWTASKWKDSEGTQGKFVAATGLARGSRTQRTRAFGRRRRLPTQSTRTMITCTNMLIS